MIGSSITELVVNRKSFGQNRKKLTQPCTQLESQDFIYSQQGLHVRPLHTDDCSGN